jgi:hypothetical protein
MFIVWDTAKSLRRSEGGPQLERYSSSIIPPLGTAQELGVDIECYRHFTPYGVKAIRLGTKRITTG